MVSGGGGLFQNATSLRSLLYYAGIVREAIRAGRRTMIFAQSIGPLDSLGTVDRAPLLPRPAPRDGPRRAFARAAAARFVPEPPIERTADPVFLYDLAGARRRLAGRRLGPRERSAMRSLAFARVPALQRRRRNDRSGGRSAGATCTACVRVSPARRRRPMPKCRPGSFAPVRSAPVLLPECSLAKAAAILRGARRGARHAAARADPCRTLRRSVSGDPVRSESHGAVRGSGVSARAAVGARRTPAGSTRSVDVLVDRLVAQRDELAAHLTRRARRDADAAAERNFDVLSDCMRDEGPAQGEAGAVP